MPQIKDLTAPQLARHAFNVFLFQGRHVTGARLVYHALVLNFNEPEALRCLSDFHDHKGTEQLSAAVMDYALAPTTPVPEDFRRPMDELRFRCIWMWGRSRHDSDRKDLAADDFRDRSRFKVDEVGYKEFVEPVIKLGGSLEGAVRGAHTLTGAMGGLLTHNQYGAKSPLEEIFHVERFHRTPEYDRWLREDTAPLDALERKRREPSPRR